MTAMATRILTWNLQGREHPDLDAIAQVIHDAGPHVVALQEVQRGQAGALAARLGLQVEWRFKHWPIVFAAEGLALLTSAAVTDATTEVLAAGARFWSWRRRIAVAATVPTPDGPLPFVVTHLGAQVEAAERVRQARRTMDLLPGGRGCLVGDLNTRPGTTVLAAYRDGGLRDAWAEVRPGEDGFTNWSPGPRDIAPDKRLDYVLVGEALEVVAAEVPEVGQPGFERFGALSDHLPVTVTVAPRA